MAIYNLTLDTLVERVARLYLRDWWGGTTTSGGSATTVVDTINRSESNDYFQSIGAQIYLREGNYAGSTRRITDFANATGTITFAPAIGGAPGTNVDYSIHARFPRAAVVDAINQAIDRIAEDALFFKVDESITLAASTYEYALPLTFMFVSEICMADTNGNFTSPPIPPGQWEIVHAAAPLLRFVPSNTGLDLEGLTYAQNTFTPTASRALRISGLASPATLSADSDVCPISPAYICAQAASILYASQVSDTNPEAKDKSNFFQAMADRELARFVPTPLPMNSKRVRE